MATTGRRVLIADDEPHIRSYLQAVLAGMGLDIVGEAANGEEALALYRELHPDLLLLDINMPKKTGKTVLAEILAQDPDAKIVILSAIADRDSVQTCLEMGARNYLLKDSSLEQIRASIEETLAEE